MLVISIVCLLLA